MQARGRISLRAKLTRLAFRALMKRSGSALSIEQIRDRFERMQRLVPPPPRGTTTRPVDVGGVPGDVVTTRASLPGRHLLYLHGGAYAVGAPRLYRHFTWRIADAARARVLVLDYRLAPEHPFPAALDDAVGAWRWLLDHGADPRQMAVAGDSAGGGLALALMLKLRDDGLPLPAAAVAMSPWTDLALTAPSFRSNAAADPMLVADDVPRFAAGYLGGADARNPYASPLYAKTHAGLPTTTIILAQIDPLRSDGESYADRLITSGVPVSIKLYPGVTHEFFGMYGLVSEATEAMALATGDLRGAFDRGFAPTPADKAIIGTLTTK